MVGEIAELIFSNPHLYAAEFTDTPARHAGLAAMQGLRHVVPIRRAERDPCMSIIVFLNPPKRG